MRGIRAAFDASGLLRDRPIRVAMRDGLYVNVVQRLTANEARELIAELEGALAQITNNGPAKRVTPTIVTPGGDA